MSVHLQPFEVSTLPAPKREHVNFRITDEGKAIIYALQDFWGLSQSGVIETVLRDLARELVRTEPDFAALLKKNERLARTK